MPFAWVLLEVCDAYLKSASQMPTGAGSSNTFYDFLYVNVLLQNSRLADVVRAYDAFTDIAFNPARP